jgi:Microtubule-binding stalk of dynein motor
MGAAGRLGRRALRRPGVPTRFAFQDLGGRQQRLVGDCLLTSAFLSYCGAFTHEFRSSLVSGRWLEDAVSRGLPISTPFRYSCRHE